MAYTIHGYVTGDDDGYRFRDWFREGQETIDAAEAAGSLEEAEAILKAAYLGADCDGVEAKWTVTAD